MTEPEHASLPWRKSSASGNSGGCVEVAVGREHVYVRHSRHADGPVLTFVYREWEAFTSGVLQGEFVLPSLETELYTRASTTCPRRGLARPTGSHYGS
jgi:hypothetical protein